MSELENQEVSEEVDEETGEEAQEDERQEQVQAVVEAEETKARDTGWKPKEEFKGNPKNWRPAAEWNEYGDKHMPFIKAELRGTKEENKALKDKLGGLESVVKKMTTVQDKLGEDSYNKSVSDIKAQRREAAEKEDWEEYDRLEEQEAQIVKPDPVAETETIDEAGQEPIENPDFDRWKKENTWIYSDRVLTRYAIALANELESKGEKGNNYAFFEKVGEATKAEFPHKFKNPKQNSSDMVESSIRGTETPESGNGAKGWDDLPAEAKQQCKKLMAEDEGYTKEDYIKLYPFDED